MRYEWTDAIKKKKVFPTPSVGWQMAQYQYEMGRPPPESDSWQFHYNPRRKADKQLFQELATCVEADSAAGQIQRDVPGQGS